MALDISKQTASITAPVFVIVGSADQVEKEPALREALLPLVPHAEFETIEGVGHLSPLKAPHEVAEAISDFLAHWEVPDRTLKANFEICCRASSTQSSHPSLALDR